MAVTLRSFPERRRQNVDVLATAPYFGYPVPNTFTLDQLFAEINWGGVAPNGYAGGMIKQVLDYAASDYSVASAAGLPLVAYEGGQTLVDYSHSDLVLQNFYATANRDPRMGAAYTNFFNGWKSLGGTLFVNFTLSGIYSQWGYWSLLENILQTSTAKYDAVINFVAANPCWWNGCARVGAAGGGSTTTSTGGTATTSLLAARDLDRWHHDDVWWYDLDRWHHDDVWWHDLDRWHHNDVWWYDLDWHHDDVWWHDLDRWHHDDGRWHDLDGWHPDDKQRLWQHNDDKRWHHDHEWWFYAGPANCRYHFPRQWDALPRQWSRQHRRGRQ